MKMALVMTVVFKRFCLSLSLLILAFYAYIEVTVDPKQIKPKNCVGTIISLNGYRRYFCIYHARHPESLTDNGGHVSYKFLKPIVAFKTI